MQDLENKEYRVVIPKNFMFRCDFDHFVVFGTVLQTFIIYFNKRWSVIFKIFIIF